MLTIQFVLNENDYLAFYLYNFSQSKSLQHSRNKSWILITTILAMLAFIFYTDDNIPLVIAFSIATVLCGFLFPIQVKKTYLERVTKQTLPLLKHNFNKPIKIIFNESDITSVTFAGESKIYHSALDKIVENNTYFFIYIKTGNTFIIPKFGLEKVETIEGILEEISKKLDINYIKDLDVKTPLSV